MLISTLEKRWARLCDGAPQVVIATTFEMLRTLYTQRARYYHTFEHIDHCLKLFDQHAAMVHAPWLVEFDLWVHDSIYIPGSKDNERCSATLGEMILIVMGRKEHVHEMWEGVLETQHQPTDRQFSCDLDVIRDIDLAILGSPPQQYQTYRYGIFHENRDLVGSQFYPLRAAFLEQMLTRPAIYRTDKFRKEFEQQARDNMAAEVAEIRRTVKA